MTTTPHGQVPALQRYKIGYHSDEWGVRSLSPVGVYDDAGPWVRYEDHAAEFRRLHAYCRELEAHVIRDCMTHVQNPAENEHVAGDVSGNGAESNMLYAELPEQVGWRDSTYHGDLYYNPPYRDGLAPLFTADQMRAFADATHALRAQQPAPAGETSKPHGWLYDWTHSSATGKPDTTYTGFTKDEAHARKHDNCTAVFTTPQPPATQQAGWKCAPVEPTDAMVQAAHHIDLSYMPGQEGADRAAIYRAMLAAAPQPTPTAQAAERVQVLDSLALMKVVMQADEALSGHCTRGTTNWAAAIGKAVQDAVLATRATAESVPAPVQSGLVATMLDALRHAQKVLNHNNLHMECGPVNAAILAARDPAGSALKDHQIAALVNELRDIAVQYHGTQQLRERIAHVVVPVLRAAPSVLEDAARLDFLIEQRAYVVSDPDGCPGYWLHFVHKETGKCWVQADEHPTPRAAIDAAMAANGGNK